MSKKSKAPSSKASLPKAADGKSTPAPAADEKDCDGGEVAAPAAPPAKPTSALAQRAPLIAGVLGVVVVAFLVGRVSVSSGNTPTSPSARSSSAVPNATAQPFVFDLTENPHSHAGIQLREMDRDIFNVLTTGNFERQRMNDYFPDKPYRVRMVGSASEKRVGAVLIDLDRDGKFDERWELKPGQVNRMVFRDEAAGSQPVMFTLAHARWMPH